MLKAIVIAAIIMLILVLVPEKDAAPAWPGAPSGNDLTTEGIALVVLVGIGFLIMELKPKAGCLSPASIAVFLLLAAVLMLTMPGFAQVWGTP